MSVNRQRDPLRQVLDARKANAVEADHHAGAACLEHRIVMLQHVIELIADIERVHQLAAGRVCQIVHDAHDCLHSLIERRVGRIGHQLIVLHEIDASLAERSDELGRFVGRQADTRLDDRADDRPIVRRR